MNSSKWSNLHRVPGRRSSMKNIWIIFKKELIDTLRDRRTLLVMILIPLLLFPILMSISTRMMISQKKKAEIKTLTVGFISRGNAARFKDLLMQQKDMKIQEDIREKEIPDLIQRNQIDFAVVFEKDFDENIREMKDAQVFFYLKSSSETEISKKRVLKLLDQYKEELISIRFQHLNLDEKIIEVFQLSEHDVASFKQKIGEVIGGFLPYIFVIFCFIGAMYPAIDLAAGEKERGTIETLLTSPASRIEIVLGKFTVIFLAGITSAGMSMLGLYLTLRQTKEIPTEILDSLMRIIDFKSIVLVFSLLIPLCIFFAAILLSISIFAQSFKEAQSIMTPMNIVVIFPVFIGLFPGIELNNTTALIPILNVSLATKEIISGTIEPGMLLEVYLSLFVLSALGLFFCVKNFQRESTIFRGN
jgi:sodium transport system permease protein